MSERNTIFDAQEDGESSSTSAESDENLEQKVEELQKRIQELEYETDVDVKLFSPNSTDKNGNPLLGVEVTISDIFSQEYLRKVLQDDEGGQ